MHPASIVCAMRVRSMCVSVCVCFFALRAEWEKKMTALHFAIALGREEMVRLLIANGARPDMMVRIRAVHDWEPVSFSCFRRKEGGGEGATLPPSLLLATPHSSVPLRPPGGQ